MSWQFLKINQISWCPPWLKAGFLTITSEKQIRFRDVLRSKWHKKMKMKPRRAYNHYHQSFYVAISVFLRWFSFVSISINPWEISFLSSRVCYPSSIYLITGSQPLCRCPPMEKHSIIIFFKTLLTDYFHQSVFFFRKAPARINNLYFPESNLIQSFQPWVKK